MRTLEVLLQIIIILNKIIIKKIENKNVIQYNNITKVILFEASNNGTHQLWILSQ